MASKKKRLRDEDDFTDDSIVREVKRTKLSKYLQLDELLRTNAIAWEELNSATGMSFVRIGGMQSVKDLVGKKNQRKAASLTGLVKDLVDKKGYFFDGTVVKYIGEKMVIDNEVKKEAIATEPEHPSNAVSTDIAAFKAAEEARWREGESGAAAAPRQLRPSPATELAGVLDELTLTRKKRVFISSASLQKTPSVQPEPALPVEATDDIDALL